MSILGNWITDGSGQPFYARTTIELPKPVRAATAKVCGLGQFVFSVNGSKVGNHELDPGWTDYRKAIQYVTFDLTDVLRVGKNALGAEIGNDWFLMDDAEGYSFHFPPFMPPNPNPYVPFGESLIFAMNLMAPSIFYMKDGKQLWNKFLMDMRLGQHMASDTFKDYEGNTIFPGDGLVPSQCPCYIPNVTPVPGMGNFYDIIPWGSSIILGTRWHYLFYGDIEVVEENYEAGRRYLAHLKSRMTEEGFICHGLGDWGNPDNELARENIETAFLYADAKTLAEFAELLGRHEDAEELSAFAEAVKANYNKRLLVRDGDGRWESTGSRIPEVIATI